MCNTAFSESNKVILAKFKVKKESAHSRISSQQCNLAFRILLISNTADNTATASIMPAHYEQFQS
jgi:hypothetical protein